MSRPRLRYLLALSASMAMSQRSSARASVATLSSFSPTTQVRRSPGGTLVRPIQHQMGLDLGYEIVTDSRGTADMLFTGGRHVKLAVNSILEISATRSDHLMLRQGKLWVRVPPGHPMYADAPKVSSHILHTEMELEVEGEDPSTATASVTVIQGKVEFFNASGRVVVRDRQRSRAQGDRAPTDPEPVSDEELRHIILWTNDVQPVALVLEPTFISQDPARLDAAQREAEALAPVPERTRRLLDVRHDRGEFDIRKNPQEGLQGLLDAYRSLFQAAVARAAPPGERALLRARMGQTLLEMGNTREADDEFKESLKLNPRETSARVGEVMVLLSERKDDADQGALAAADRAVEGDAQSPITHTAQALALIRAAKRAEAQKALEAAIQLDPTYAQAYAWQAFLYGAAERVDDALGAAQNAVKYAPRSSLARQMLSDAWFRKQRFREARAEAKLALDLNPLSPGAQVSLGRALLQEGKLDQAVPRAFDAVALDPSLDRARFFLGLVLWEQQRLDQAREEFQQAVKLDPGYLEARAYLARVYVEQGRTDDAKKVAREALALDPDHPTVRAALGLIDYTAGRLPEAVTDYQRALDLLDGAPGPSYELGLARAYLEENDLPDALDHGLRAVSEEPRSHEAHTLLGLVYDRRSETEQAQREYREALSLYPDDALARLGLGTSASSSEQRVRDVATLITGGAAVTKSGDTNQLPFITADTGDGLGEIAQALLRDPSVLPQVFKPGKRAEIAPGGGSRATSDLGLTHRDLYSSGKLFDLSFGDRLLTDNYRNDRPEKHTYGWVNLTAAPDYQNHVLLQYLYSAADLAVPGPLPLLGATSPATPNGRSAFSENSWDLSTRSQLSPGTFLWFHVTDQASTTVDQDPDTVGDGFSFLPEPSVQVHSRYRQAAVEGRLDHEWGGGHTTSYVLFGGRDHLDQPRLVYTRELSEFGEKRNLFSQDQLVTQTLQHQYQSRAGLSILVGATAESSKGRTTVTNPGEVVVVSQSTRSRDLFPFGEATYIISRRDLVRLVSFRRGPSGFNPLLQPAEAFLVDEFPALGAGTQATNRELDYEHRFSERSFAKLFLFDGRITNYVLAPEVTQTINPVQFSDSPFQGGSGGYLENFIVPDARVRGVGVRYEHQFGSLVSSFVRYTYREFTNQDRDDRGDHNFGRQLPLNPRSRVLFGLNYIDGAGTKVFFQGDWGSGLYAGVFRTNTPWVRLPAKFVASLRLAKEPSLGHEWAFSIDNLLNVGTIYWPGFPAPGRTYRVQYSYRF